MLTLNAISFTLLEPVLIDKIIAAAPGKKGRSLKILTPLLNEVPEIDRFPFIRHAAQIVSWITLKYMIKSWEFKEKIKTQPEDLLFRALHHSDRRSAIFKRLIKTFIPPATNIDYPNQKEVSLLHTAVSVAKTDEITLILDTYKLDPNIKTASGMTPRHLVAYHNNHPLDKVLFDHVATRGVTDNNGNSPLHFFCLNPSNRYMNISFSYDANDLAKANRKGEYPFHLAAAIGNQQLIDLSVQKGLYITLPNNRGENILLYALQACDVVLFHYLVETYKLSLDTIDDDGRNILDAAIASGNVDILQYLMIKSPGLVTEQNAVNIIKFAVSVDQQNGDNLMPVTENLIRAGSKIPELRQLVEQCRDSYLRSQENKMPQLENQEKEKKEKKEKSEENIEASTPEVGFPENLMGARTLIFSTTGSPDPEPAPEPAPEPDPEIVLGKRKSTKLRKLAKRRK